ncbi:hypothetical protein D5086_011002 [Populus alba]|uniref:Uncharacterized protein n=1 Tax=Populus alba TaxID=43335 RepID=A0ACC4CDI2_POPAL
MRDSSMTTPTLIELIYRLPNGNDIGPNKYTAAATVATLKEYAPDLHFVVSGGRGIFSRATRTNWFKTFCELLSYEPKLVSLIKEFDLLYRIMSYRRDQKGHNVITIPYDASNQQNAILFTDDASASTLFASIAGLSYCNLTCDR